MVTYSLKILKPMMPMKRILHLCKFSSESQPCFKWESSLEWPGSTISQLLVVSWVLCWEWGSSRSSSSSGSASEWPLWSSILQIGFHRWRKLHCSSFCNSINACQSFFQVPYNWFVFSRRQNVYFFHFCTALDQIRKGLIISFHYFLLANLSNSSICINIKNLIFWKPILISCFSVSSDSRFWNLKFAWKSVCLMAQKRTSKLWKYLSAFRMLRVFGIVLFTSDWFSNWLNYFIITVFCLWL